MVSPLSDRAAFVKRIRAVACAAGIPAAGRWLRRHQLLILCYHGIAPADDTRLHSTLSPLDEFTEQMQQLGRDYLVLDLDTALHQLRRGQLSRPTAAVTFDDGYQSVADLAHPVLQSLGIPYTVYLVTDLVASNAIPWPLALELSLERGTAREIDLPGRRAIPLPEGPGVDRRRACRVAVECFKELPARERREALASIIDPLDHRDLDRERRFALMDWNAIDSLARSGLVTFGAHTATHEILSTLESEAVTREIVGSIRTVRERVRTPSNSFAYPNGRQRDIDERSNDALKEAGVLAGLTTIYGRATGDGDPFRIPRLVIGGSMNIDDFSLRAAGMWVPYR